MGNWLLLFVILLVFSVKTTGDSEVVCGICWRKMDRCEKCGEYHCSNGCKRCKCKECKVCGGEGEEED